jgi:hypothetical protein
LPTLAWNQVAPPSRLLKRPPQELASWARAVLGHKAKQLVITRDTTSE